MNKDIKHRTKLNPDQLQVLKILSKFRYATAFQIALLQGKKSSEFVHKRLSILLSQEYIGRKYKPSYKLLGKPAAYYLTPKGGRAFIESSGSELNIRSLYQDSSRSEGFVNHCISRLDIYLRLSTEATGSLKFFTSFELRAFPYMPKPLPDAYVRILDKHYFLELYDTSKEFYPNLKNLRKYVSYEESDVWSKTGKDFPIVLVICEESKRALKLIEKLSRYSSQVSYAFAVDKELETANSKTWFIDDYENKQFLDELE